jgi:hypothetical protein
MCMKFWRLDSILYLDFDKTWMIFYFIFLITSFFVLLYKRDNWQQVVPSKEILHHQNARRR